MAEDSLADIHPRPGDGRISLRDAAKLARVSYKTMSRWVCDGDVQDVRREGRSLWLNPKEVIEVEYVKHARERERMRLVLGVPL
jgi:predicted site-specific integrase-resolvase